MTYTKTVWINGTSPAIGASTLNHLGDGIEAAHFAIATFDAALASYLGAATALGVTVFDQATALYEQGQELSVYPGQLSTSNAVLATIAAENILQTDAIASNTSGVASLLPAVAAQGSSISAWGPTQTAQLTEAVEIGTTNSIQQTDLGPLATTQASQLGNIGDLGATQISHHSGIVANASAIAFLEGEIADSGLTGRVQAVRDTAQPIPHGWLDIRKTFKDVTISDMFVYASPIVSPAAKYIRFRPMATLGEANGLQNFRFITSTYDDGQFGTTGPGEISAAVLDASGNVLTAAEATLLPSGIPTTHPATWINLPFTHGTAILNPGENYYLALAAELSPLSYGIYITEAPARVAWAANLAFQYIMPSGHNLASYDFLPINEASTLPAALNDGLGGGGLPAMFVDDL